MPLQNRVTPFGEIVAVASRGMFTGNRGIIHDPATKTLLSRRWSSHAWITCTCEFRGRRRDVMATRSWTELFFLDEATALAHCRAVLGEFAVPGELRFVARLPRNEGGKVVRHELARDAREAAGA